MAGRARAAGVKLRPHAKTHKVPEIGRMQLALGAAGLSLAKVGEAEVFAEASFEDIFLAYPTVGGDRARRLLALSDRVAPPVGADSRKGGARSPTSFAPPTDRLSVLLKIDCGFHRVGVEPERALELAARGRGAAGARARGRLHTRRTGVSRRDRGGGRRGWPTRGGDRRRRRRRAPRSRASGRRGLGRLDPDGGVRDARAGASPSAGPATTCTTTPLRWRSAPARRRTAR